MGRLGAFAGDRGDAHRWEGGDPVTGDGGVAVGGTFATADRVEQPWSDRVRPSARGCRHEQVDLAGGVPPGLLVVRHLDDAGDGAGLREEVARSGSTSWLPTLVRSRS